MTQKWMLTLSCPPQGHVTDDLLTLIFRCLSEDGSVLIWGQTKLLDMLANKLLLWICKLVLTPGAWAWHRSFYLLWSDTVLTQRFQSDFNSELHLSNSSAYSTNTQNTTVPIYSKHYTKSFKLVDSKLFWSQHRCFLDKHSISTLKEKHRETDYILAEN